MTPAEIITQVRRLVQDELTATQRYSDSVLLGYVNQAVKRVLAYRPDLFITTENVALTANTVNQTLPSGAVRLVEIYQVVDGDALVEVNRETLDQMYPGWRTEAPGTPVNWMRHPRNPNGFHVYPRPPANTSVVAEYVKVPSDYASSDTIIIPNAYLTAMVDCVVFLVESVDAEHVNNGRAKFFYDNFLAGIGADFTQRVTVDSENASVGQEPQQTRSTNNGR